LQTIRILLEHLYKEKESGVRAKVVMLLAELSQSPGYDPSPLVDDIITAMKREGETSAPLH
jgi:HEAT repeat protein